MKGVDYNYDEIIGDVKGDVELLTRNNNSEFQKKTYNLREPQNN